MRGSSSDRSPSRDRILSSSRDRRPSHDRRLSLNRGRSTSRDRCLSLGRDRSSSRDNRSERSFSISPTRGERSSSVMELERDISCAICNELYTDPKVLPCMHYFCSECIHMLAVKNGMGKPFSCPECSTNIILPSGGIPSLKPALFINRMKETHRRLSRAHGEVETICESCSEGTAESFCQQCTMFICSDCIRPHQKMKIFAGHKIVSLQELKEGKAEDILVEPTSFQMCSVHTKEELKIYCFDCSSLICRDCIIKDHRDHNHEFTDKAAAKVKEILLDKLIPLKEIRGGITCGMEEVRAARCEVETQIDTVTTQIRCVFAELQKVLTNRKQQLLGEVDTRAAEKLDCLSDQESKLSTTCAAVQSVIEYTEQCILHSADDELLCLHDEIQNRIDKEVTERGHDSIYPVEEADIGLDATLAKDLRHLCQTRIKLSQLRTGVSIAGEGKMAVVNRKSEFVVIAKLGDGKLKQRFTLQCHLKSLANGFTYKCQVERNDDTYHISYTPTVRGRHEICITAPGLDIPGNPFPVFVSIHPTQLVRPVRIVSEGFHERPNHVGVFSTGDMIVAGNYCTVIFDAIGQKVDCLNLMTRHGVLPYGLTVDCSDTIFIPCRASIGPGSFLIKFSPEMKVIKRSSKFNADFQDMSTIGDELIVCNDKDRSIMVFNKELESLRSFKIAPGWMTNLNTVTSDDHGNIYICGSDSPILVFTTSGHFIRSFAGKNLVAPYGICVSGNFVYVTDRTSHDDILAFTSDGEYITQHSYCNFDGPFGMCVDRDGFIYVCDQGNKRVVIL